MENEENFRSIYSRYLANQCDEEELLLLHRHFRTSNERELLSLIRQELEKEEDPHEPTFKERMKLERLRGQIHAHIAEKEGEEPVQQDLAQHPWMAYQVAATVLLFFGLVAGYFLLNRHTGHPRYEKEPAVYTGIKFPEGKVFLRLHDGQLIPLKGGKGGIRIAENQVVYQDGTTVLDQLSSAALELIVTKGGQYRVNLPDGSDVWLNASSRLTVHPRFMKAERKVELEGEGFFAVKKAADGRRKLPFIVETGMQKIEVLGTQFNVSAYREEPAVRTTLVEGKVKVSAVGSQHVALLNPNEESLVQKNKSLIVQTADTAKALAWKNGYFKFNGDNIQEIMLKVSRWYDVEVDYDGPVTSEEFVGMISIHENLNQVLDMLSLTGNIRFKRENQKIIVLPRKVG